jgi:peptidoglycan/LPS O-acetylase OafA/YrhL
MVLLLVGISTLTTRGTLVESPVALGVYYPIFFVAGAALARERQWIAALMSRLPTWLLYGSFSAALVLYFESAAIVRSQRIADLMTMCGALIMIALVPQPRLRVGLRTAVSGYLGKISYSLYLVHGTVLFTLLNLLYYRVSLPVLAAIYTVVSLLVAHLFHLAVEEPSLQLGKNIARSMRAGKARKVAASGV